MKYTFTLLSFLSIIALSAQSFNSPESVEFDGANHRWLVGNNGAGTVSSDYPNSALAVPFSTGSPMGTGPHGIEILNGVLYCCDGNAIQGYNLTTGAPVFSLNLNANFLNGMTSDGANYLFVTDFNAKKIYRVCPATNSFNIMCSTLKTPNGILYDGANNRCVFVTWGANAPIQAMSLADSSISTLTTTTLSNCDGVTEDHAGYWYVSSWGNNSLNRFSPTFTTPTVVMPGLNSPADISINANGDSIAIPNSGSTTVVFYTNITTGMNVYDNTNFVAVNPNPAKDNLQINFSQDLSGAKIQLLDAAGKCVREFEMNGFSSEIETSDLENGFYILSVMDSNKNFIARKKILISK
jgi:hypothetical protein